MGILVEPDPGRAADPGRARVLHRWSRVLRWTAATAFALPLLVARWAGSVEEPVVIGRVVAAPEVVGPVLALLGTALALGGAAAGLAARDAGAAPGSRRRLVRWPVNAGKAALLVAGWVGAGVAVLLGMAAGDARVLEPASPGGCRVVAVEHPYDGVTLHLVPAGSFRARPGVAVAAAGHAPVSLGTHALTWDGEVGEVELRGVLPYPADAEPARAEVDCTAPRSG
ncbi:hypothetical protein [Cellulomonas sp.]|uniref:hypothetical protein n=1 Tax=Cellulomonas sp. TaxID=40001 RepID=UPI002D46BA3F|nr:hypothetical protein [Cellulomonas sp.]HYQ77386.1 hypothetical protein [Cellulomonas sp.]